MEVTEKKRPHWNCLEPWMAEVGKHRGLPEGWQCDDSCACPDHSQTFLERVTSKLQDVADRIDTIRAEREARRAIEHGIMAPYHPILLTPPSPDMLAWRVNPQRGSMRRKVINRDSRDPEKDIAPGFTTTSVLPHAGSGSEHAAPVLIKWSLRYKSADPAAKAAEYTASTPAHLVVTLMRDADDKFTALLVDVVDAKVSLTADSVFLHLIERVQSADPVEEVRALSSRPVNGAPVPPSSPVIIADSRVSTASIKTSAAVKVSSPARSTAAPTKLQPTCAKIRPDPRPKQLSCETALVDSGTLEVSEEVQMKKKAVVPLKI